MKISRSYRLLRLYTWLEGVKCVSMAHVGTRTIQRDIADIRAFLAEEKMQKGCDRTVLFDVVKGGYVLWQQ